MKVLIASDKFKGSLTSQQVCTICHDVLVHRYPKASFDIQPMADGGDGTGALIAASSDLELISIDGCDALFRLIRSHYYRDKTSAYIEMAASCGLALLSPDERNAYHTSSYGLGVAIRQALDDPSIETLHLFLGGSATNDLGVGMATALGYQFSDRDGKEIFPIPSQLSALHEINQGHIHPRIKEVQTHIYTDVTNPLLGPQGATYIYGPQKGIPKDQVAHLEGTITHVHDVLSTHFSQDVSLARGAGAAGGMGAGCSYFLNAAMHSGIEWFLSRFDMAHRIAEADIVITGEGCLDQQSLDGKVVSGVLDLAMLHGTKVIIVCGRNRLESPIEATILSLSDVADSTEDSITNAQHYLKNVIERIVLPE
ncbi:MAG: glycerate kinase [Bacteroidota bacterium]